MSDILHLYRRLYTSFARPENPQVVGPKWIVVVGPFASARHHNFLRYRDFVLRSRHIERVLFEGQICCLEACQHIPSYERLANPLASQLRHRSRISHNSAKAAGRRLGKLQCFHTKTAQPEAIANITSTAELSLHFRLRPGS